MSGRRGGGLSDRYSWLHSLFKSTQGEISSLECVRLVTRVHAPLQKKVHLFRDAGFQWNHTTNAIKHPNPPPPQHPHNYHIYTCVYILPCLSLSLYISSLSIFVCSLWHSVCSLYLNYYTGELKEVAGIKGMMAHVYLTK